MNKIELKHVSFVYSKGTPFEMRALEDVSVGFEAGKITGLIGQTGSGKSTLVNLLNGLYKPAAGEVLLDGVNIWDKPKEIGKVRFRVGLVMQYPEYQLFDDTVRRDIGFAPRNLGLPEEEIAARVEEAARFTGLEPELLDKSPFDLSGGQKRRVAIAGVLAMRPEVLVLDEPAAGLDPQGRRTILSGLTEYARKTGVTVILVSHSMEDMAYYCDNVVVMYRAKLYKAGTVSEIFRDTEHLAAIGLDVPEISVLTQRLIAAGIPLEGQLYTVEGVRDAVLRLLAGKEGRP